jgi:transcriptional regulator with XRE-family HTH domain
MRKGGEEMNFKDLLKSKGFTMYKLAKKTELGQCTINQIANGKRKSIKLPTAVKIAKALNVDIETVNRSIGSEFNGN